MPSYPFQEVEPKWQRFWEDRKTFATPSGPDPDRPKFYVLDMFPYPSGAGLHVGHPEGYTATDILARYKRMRGYNVLHPMGWDAFGLPAEQYAIETGAHPGVTTNRNIDGFRTQLKRLGFSYDWDRELATTDPEYYKWTQWIFLKLYERGLAYEAKIPVNWCPALGTVLANEEVVDGKSDRGGHPVIRVPMRQWMLKITAYADRLLEDLDDVDWPESIKEMQRNWIGRSFGADVDFSLDTDPETKIRIYTTRPDTLFGATYMVLSPEYEGLGALVTEAESDAVKSYQQKASTKSELERTGLQKDKTGVFTGAYAVNPVNLERIPIWIADYVMSTYGTGAIMAVPGHDERDYAFARRYNLPIREVVSGGNIDAAAWSGDGLLMNSTSELVSLDGLSVPDAIEKISDWIEEQSVGVRKVNYKLRDWLFSRQRYWGEPMPIIHVDGVHKAVPESDLPVRLPQVDSYQPTGTGESPLAGIADWVNTTDPETGRPALRETNTMPQWAGSCWYYLRFIDPTYVDGPVNPELEKYWMPVDLYVGGAEHAVLHLLYARFWHKVLFDIGVVSTTEPFQRLYNQGMILGEVELTQYRQADGLLISAEAVSDMTSAGGEVTPERVEASAVRKDGEHFVLIDQPEIRVAARAYKMSKSRGNVVNPDTVVEKYGADSLRLYEMFMGPLDQVKPWSMQGVAGVSRYLNRVWRLLTEGEGISAVVTSNEPDVKQLEVMHRTIRKVTDDIEGMRFNTSISALMEMLNAMQKWSNIPQSVAETYVLLMAPFAPHMAEELWSRLGNADSLAYADWPKAKEKYLRQQRIEIAVQVNGKMRGSITIDADLDKDAVLTEARAVENVVRHIGGKQMRREVYVPGRIVNFVVS